MDDGVQLYCWTHRWTMGVNYTADTSVDDGSQVYCTAYLMVVRTAVPLTLGANQPLKVVIRPAIPFDPVGKSASLGCNCPRPPPISCWTTPFDPNLVARMAQSVLFRGRDKFLLVQPSWALSAPTGQSLARADAISCSGYRSNKFTLPDSEGLIASLDQRQAEDGTVYPRECGAPFNLDREHLNLQSPEHQELTSKFSHPCAHRNPLTLSVLSPPPATMLHRMSGRGNSGDHVLILPIVLMTQVAMGREREGKQKGTAAVDHALVEIFEFVRSRTACLAQLTLQICAKRPQDQI
eukprot:535799-Pelagomonas_calceolata.AAC.5